MAALVHTMIFMCNYIHQLDQLNVHLQLGCMPDHVHVKELFISAKIRRDKKCNRLQDDYTVNGGQFYTRQYNQRHGTMTKPNKKEKKQRCDDNVRFSPTLKVLSNHNKKLRSHVIYLY